MIYFGAGHVGTSQSPLDHPRICFHKWPATVTATSTSPGTNTAWVMDGQTYNKWRAGSGNGSITLTFSDARNVNYIGIAAHDFDLAGSTLSVQVNTGSGFENVIGLASVVPGDDSAILCLIGPVLATAVRIVFAGPTAPRIGVLQAGLSMNFPRQCTYAALPISESEQTTYRLVQSIRGEVLGRIVEAAELGFTVDIANLSEAFRQDDGIVSWPALTKHVRDVGPMFIATRSGRYRDDVAYGVMTERPRFNRSIPNYAISGTVSMNFKGYKRP